MLSASVCSKTLAGPLMRWLIVFRLRNKSQTVRDSNHDEQSDPPERRSRAKRQLRINRRRPVIGSVRLLDSLG